MPATATAERIDDDHKIIVPDDMVVHFASKWWRLNNLYHILDEQGKEVLFRCNGAQWRFWSEMWYWNIILKSRQQGFTTFVDIFILDDAIWNDNLECGIIAHNREDAKKIFRRKIQFPYNHLPQWIKDQRPLVTDSAQELAFENGSIIYVATSLRSGTVQRCHVSEHGKICRLYPKKAEEVRSGTVNAIHPGSFFFVESTAEGRFGDFFDWCKRAQDYAEEGRQLTQMDFKLHFAPWWVDPKCVMPDHEIDLVVIPKEKVEYFAELEVKINDKPSLFNLLPEGKYVKGQFRLNRAQRAWYVKKEETMQDKMFQEYPSTPEEAFDASIQGAYFAKQMLKMRQDKRIGRVPHDIDLPVDIAWDIGLDDTMFLVCRQSFRWENRIINCYSNHDESFHHYVQWIQDQGYTLGKMYLPHDSAKRSLRSPDKDTRLVTLQGLMPGIKMVQVERTRALMEKIHSTRLFLNTCWIDEENCQELIRCLDGYRQAWDERLGQWKGEAVHDECSHGASAIGEFAQHEDPGHDNLPPKRGWRRRRPGGRAR